MTDRKLTPVAAARTLAELLQILREMGELLSPGAEFVTLVIETPGRPDTVVPVKVSSEAPQFPLAL